MGNTSGKYKYADFTTVGQDSSSTDKKKKKGKYDDAEFTNVSKEIDTPKEKKKTEFTKVDMSTPADTTAVDTSSNATIRAAIAGGKYSLTKFKPKK